MCAPGEQRKKKKKKTIRIEREINFNPKMSFLITNYPHGGCMWGRAERDIMFRVVIEKLINSNTFFSGEIYSGEAHNNHWKFNSHATINAR